MASGFWSETDKPIRPGFYNRFKAAALARIQIGKRGIVGMPVKANWGPVKKIERVTSEKDLINKYGSDMDYTAYKLGRLVLLGGPKELLLYRLTDGKEKPATLTLKAGEKDVLKLDTIYPTTRDFKITIEPNILDEDLVNMVLYEGSRPLFTFKKLEGTAKEVAETINKNAENKWLVATALEKDSEEQIKLEPIVSVAMTGGNDGTGEIAVDDYIEAMGEFEGRNINGFSLDGVTTLSLQTSVAAWVDRNRKAGKKIRAYMGGTEEETLEEAIKKAKTTNNEAVMYVGAVGGILDEIEYTPAETACYIMGLGEGQDMKECLANEVTVFQDVTRHLSHEEVEDSILGGVMVLVEDDGAIVVEDDVNTLTRYGQDQNEIWGNLRAIRFLDMVDEDTSYTGNKQYVGNVLNGRNGQLAVLTALKQYFETLQSAELIEDFTVEIDHELQANAASDEFYWVWDAKYINVMKKIFGTGYIR